MEPTLGTRRPVGLAMLCALIALPLSNAVALGDDTPRPPRHGAGAAMAEDDETADDEAADDGAGEGGASAPDAPERDEPPVDPEKAALEAMQKEINRLQTEYNLLQQRQKAQLAEAELRQRELSTMQSLRRAEQQAELDELKAEVERLNAERSLREARRRAEEMAVEEQADAIKAENTILNARIARINTQISAMEAEYRERTAELAARMAYLDRRRQAADHVLTEVAYPRNPLIDGTLYISDRRIPLNGPIWYGTANRVCDRIHFFNNQDPTAPIFIVIDDSPGGSVLEGYRIVKAIESSRAPVHVVVKSFAASMAAVITTLAPHSYAYPNAIILHHQMSYGMSGNVTQHEEQLEASREWSRRLADPVARKMGVSLDRLVELMYENNSDGDWSEFADEAVALKWVDHVVREIREDGIVERPEDTGGGGFFFFLAEHEQLDPTSGQRFVRLPRLKPFDAYFLYNPDGYFRP